MFGNNKCFCLWLVIFGSCFANKFEERFEKLEKEFRETKEELMETKNELLETRQEMKQQTQMIDFLKKEMDDDRNKGQISKPLCKFLRNNCEIKKIIHF